MVYLVFIKISHNQYIFVNQFLDVDMGEIISNNIALCKYDKPTPIQKYAISSVLARRDLMACAQTGI